MDGVDQDEALTPAERALVDSVEGGALFDLAGDRPVDELAMRSWDDSRTVRAWVIRDIVRGRRATKSDPHGLRLRGARIAGQLDLANITSSVAVELTDCLLTDGVDARHASLPVLALTRCRLEHPSGPALQAQQLIVAVFRLYRATVVAHSTQGAVILRGAHFGLLDCRGTSLVNDSGPALHADNLRVTQTAVLRDGFHAAGNGEDGAVRLLGAHISGQLECDGACLRNDSGPALVADGLRVDQSVFFRSGFDAAASSEMGAIRLSHAFLGHLDCRGARLRNDSGPALTAEGLRVDLNVSLPGLNAVGTGPMGAVRLVGAHIGGQLACADARLRNGSGPALVADKLRVDQSVFFHAGFGAIGTGERGAVRLAAAHLDHLDCRGARLRNDAGPALHAEDLHVTRDVYLDDGFEAVGSGDGVVVDLRGMRAGGVLSLAPARLAHHTNPRARLRVDGLTYTGLPQGVSTTAWLDLLREGTPAYTAQPYQHFAAAHRAAGDDTTVRRVLMAQRRDQIDRRALTGRAARGWARTTGLLLGYGYQPWRALIGLLATVTVAVILAIRLGNEGLAQVHTSPASPTPTACTLLEQVGVGLDLGTPLITTGARAPCDTTNTANGNFLTIAGWLLRLVAWGFASLFIAGFTSAIRKT